MSSQEKLHLVPGGRDRKDEETNAKMRVLWTILIVLVIALIAAIVYEIVLGNGIQQTGSERMEEISRKSVIEAETETEIESETEPETEIESETGYAVDTEAETIKDSGQSEGAASQGTPYQAGIAGL